MTSVTTPLGRTHDPSTSGESMGAAGSVKRRCSQCWQKRIWPEEFIGRRGRPVQMCRSCQDIYYGRENKSAEERAALRPRRTGLNQSGETRIIWSAHSGNKKTGPIPTAIVSPDTCPTTCSLYGAGCYAEYGFLRAHWARCHRQGISWEEFCARVSELPSGSRWRYGVAGDLPGRSAQIDESKLALLLEANHSRGGFAFTHKPVLDADPHLCQQNSSAIRRCNEAGFVVSLSADSAASADRLAELLVAPVVALLPRWAPARGNRTPQGRRIQVCAYETQGTSCARCGLCAVPGREVIVGFRAHGQLHARVSALADASVEVKPKAVP